MNNEELVVMLFLCAIGAGIIGFFIASTFLLPFLGEPNIPGMIPPPDVIQFYVLLKTVISFINIALILFTLAVYLDLYRTIRTKFTLGLVTMLAVLLMYAVTSNPLLHARFGFQSIGCVPTRSLSDNFSAFNPGRPLPWQG